MTSSLDEERVWAQELESERDEFRERLEAETRLKENLDAERQEDIGALRLRVKELEEHLLKRDTVVQQCKNELLEKERVIKEKEEASRSVEGFYKNQGRCPHRLEQQTSRPPLSSNVLSIYLIFPIILSI